MDDAISRLAVIQIIEKMRARIGHNLERSVGRAMIEILDEVGEDVEKLPSAQPEPSQVARDIARIVENEQDMRILPKTGHWIIYTVSPFDGADVKCSECGQRGCATYWDYCPNCGARMEGVHVD